MKKILQSISILASALLFPIIVFAQNLPSRQILPLSTASTCVTNNQLGYFLCTIQQLLNSIIPVLVALGVVYFVWGVVQYVIGGGEEAKKKGRDRIIYGIIGLAIIASLAGIVNIVVSSFGFGAQTIAMPTLVPTTTATSSGAACSAPTNFQTFMGYITCLINNSVIPLIFAIAIVTFIWGAVNFFIINSAEEAKRQQGKQFMLWGIVALTVMLCVWWLVAMLGGTFSIGGGVLPQVHPPTSASQ